MNDFAATCPECSAPLTVDAPEGLCPQCLLRLALEETAAGPPAAAALDIGEQIPYLGDYELVREIGRGGMGVVYEARQLSLDRTVAVKLLLGGAWSAPEMIERFRTEARAAARLEHPNIVAVHEIGEQEGQPFFSMSYVEGGNLEELVQRGGVTPDRAARLVRDVARAVHAAHEQSILHRDLKPSNVLLDSADQPHVTDFGLAKYLAADQGLTNTGQFLGTPGYMPPEQVRGVGQEGRASRASDVYSLGAILYALLTGRPPFRAETALETALAVLDSDPEAPRQIDDSLPRDLETVCLKCLARDPTERYGTAEDLAADLDRFLGGAPVSARRLGWPERAWRHLKRRRWQAAAALLAVTLVIAGALQLEDNTFATHLALARANSRAGDHSAAFEELAAAGEIRHTVPLRSAAIEVLTTPAVSPMLSLPVGSIWDMHLSASGRFVAAGGSFRKGNSSSEQRIEVWDLDRANDSDGPVLSIPSDSPLFAVVDERLVTYDTEYIWQERHDSAGGSERSAVGTKSEAISIWDLDSQEAVETLDWPRTGVGIGTRRELILSPSGRLLARRDKVEGKFRVSIWNLEDGSIETLPLFGRSVAFAGEERLLMVVRNRVVLCDLKQQEISAPWGEASLRTYDAAVTTGVFDTAEGGVEVWSLRTRVKIGALAEPFSAGRSGPGNILLGPHGQSLAAHRVDRNEIHLFEVEALDEEPRILRLQPENIVFMEGSAFSPDGTFLAVTGGQAGQGIVWVWDLAAGQEIAALRDQWKPRWAPNGRLLTVGGSRLRWNDAESSHSTVTMKTSGQDLAVGNTSVNIWRLFSSAAFAQLSRGFTSLSFHPQGDQLAVGSQVFSLSRQDQRMLLGREREASTAVALERLRFDPQGNAWHLERARPADSVPILLRRLGQEKPILRRYDYSAQALSVPENSIPYPQAHSIAFAPDGKTAVITSELRYDSSRGAQWSQSETLVELWDLETGTRRFVHTSTEHDDGQISYRAAAFSPKGERFVAGERVFDTASGQAVVELDRYRSQNSACFSPDGRRIYGESYGKWIVMLDAQTGEKLRSWNAGQGHLRGVALSPDGRVLASVGHNPKVALWDASTGREIARWPAHDTDSTSVAFAPQGLLLATGGSDGTVKLWDLERLDAEMTDLGIRLLEEVE